MTAAPEINRIRESLGTVGYAKTYYQEIGVEFNTHLAEEVATAAIEGVFSPGAAELTKHIDKQEMTMVQDDRTMEMGRLLVAPAVERLFEEHPQALTDWELYALNCYQEGGSLGVHQDSVEKTVLVITASGVRNLDVYNREETEVSGFTTPEASFRLEPSSIMILDGEADVGHAIECVKGPSVSAVLDVPAMLRL